MAIEKSTRFTTDTQGNVQSSIPLIIIYKGVRSDNIDEIDTIPDTDKLFISTNNIYFDGQYYKPILNKTPSIKQTIDDENKKFRIQTTNIEINNSEFHGARFTDELQLITNCAIRIYYKTQSCKSLDDCILLAQTTIKEFRQRNERISVITEDSTQALLEKTIPQLAEGIEYAVNDQNKAIPIVYGNVTKSPVIKKIDPFSQDSEGNGAVTSLVCDTKAIAAIQSEVDYTEYPTPVAQHMQVLSPVYVYDEGYLNIVNTVPTDIESRLEFNTNIDIDTTLPLFQISGNQIILTEEYTKFKNALNTSIFFEDLELTSAIMSRIFRKFTGISGKKKSMSAEVESNTFVPFGGRLFATTDWSNDNVWIGSGVDYPRVWSEAMYQEDNYQLQSEACFPFAHDNYIDWENDGTLSNEGLLQNGDELESNLLENWNVPNEDGTPSIFNLKPINYLNYIYENDDRALCWYGKAHSNLEQQGSFVNWTFTLDDLGYDHKCRTYVFMDMYHYQNQNINYGTSGRDEYLSGTALWADTVSVPVLHRLDIDDFPRTQPLGDNAKESWKFWNTIAPDDSLLDGYNNVVQRKYEGESYGLEIARDWNSTSQIRSINVGQPNFVHKIPLDTSIQYTTGALNYLHFIQDVFIESPDTKDWYVNVLGRKTDETIWSPFNSWELQTIPYYEDNDEAFTYIKSRGYSDNFGTDEDTSGGELGWIVNTGTQFSLRSKLSEFAVIPEKMWYLDENGNESVFENGDWSVNYDITIGRAFIVFSTIPVRVAPFENYNFPSHYIRMNHIVGTDNDWEQGFTPIQALQQVNENYIANGWKNYLYTPEIGLGGAIERPNEVIQHLITSETGYSADNFSEINSHKAFATHQGWRMAFTINEQQEVKEIIQELSTNTKLFPRFAADGTFDFTTLKSFYNSTDVNYRISKTDAINWGFELSKIEHVNNQYKVLYEYDYATEKYNEIVPDFIYTRSQKVYNDYGDVTNFLYDNMINTPDNWIYDIKKLYNKEKDESTKEFEAKYIRHRYTAEQLKKHLLMENINEHLIINMTLSNKYTDLEIGDILYIDQLSDELGLGYKYWAYEVKGGQLLYPFYFITEVNKNNNQVVVKLKRLHRLQYGLPNWLIQNTLLDPEYMLPDNFSAISDVNDDGGIYNSTLQNLEQDFDANFEDYPQDINNEFSIKWYPYSYSNALYEQDTVIRLDVVQNGYYNQDTQNWTAEVWEDGNWYTDQSPRFAIVSYSNPDNNYNGYVIVKASQNNDTNQLISGKLRITDNLGRSYQSNFYQDFLTTEDDFVLGDLNGDGIVNVLDVVQLVGLAINNEYNAAGDLNGDGGINVLDVVLLANIILET